MIRLPELEITLHASGNSAYTGQMRYSHSTAGASADFVSEGSIDLDGPELLAATITPMEYGQRLTDMVFGDSRMRNAWDRAITAAESVGLPLRVRISLDPTDPILHTLHWETLQDPISKVSIALSGRVLLSRYPHCDALTTMDAPQYFGIRPLVVVANPIDTHDFGLMPFDAVNEVKRACAALGPIQTAVLARALNRPAATAANLLTALRDGPHVLYLVCHGMLQQGETYLLLERDDGSHQWVKGSILAQTLRNLNRRPSLIVLAACHSAGASHQESAFTSIAQQLSCAGIPAVVAMQGSISVEALSTFTHHFFTELRRSGQIDRAMAAARSIIEQRGHMDWWAPALFMRSQDGQLWRPSQLHNQILDQSRLIEQVTRGFIGREFVFKAIRQCIETTTETGRYFVVSGDPGIGKSALAAQLVKRYSCVHHFNVRAEGLNSLQHFLRNVCAQLITQYYLDYSELPDEALKDGEFLKRLLRDVSAKMQVLRRRAVIVIDALDEVDRASRVEGNNPLLLPTLLPPRVCIIATTRRETIEAKEKPIRILSDPPAIFLPIEQNSAENLHDIENYLRARTKTNALRSYLKARHLSDADFVAQLTAKSQGNFMYLYYVLPEIERGAYNQMDLEKLPAGLENYYDDHWERMKVRAKADWFRIKLRVLARLTTAPKPMSPALIAQTSGLEVSEVLAVLEEWAQFIHAEHVLGQNGVQKRYRLYHASFHDFIAAKSLVVAERFSLPETHNDTGTILFDKLYGN